MNLRIIALAAVSMYLLCCSRLLVVFFSLLTRRRIFAGARKLGVCRRSQGDVFICGLLAASSSVDLPDGR